MFLIAAHLFLLKKILSYFLYSLLFPSFLPPDVFHQSAGDLPTKTILRRQRSSDGSLDMTEINVALIPRPSEVEALVGASPLRELLNYSTGITFEGFLPAESELCEVCVWGTCRTKDRCV